MQDCKPRSRRGGVPRRALRWSVVGGNIGTARPPQRTLLLDPDERLYRVTWDAPRTDEEGPVWDVHSGDPRPVVWLAVQQQSMQLLSPGFGATCCFTNLQGRLGRCYATRG